MKAKKRNRGYVTILLFALAATMLIFSTVGSSRAALTYYSTTYGAEVQLQDIGITLEENGVPVDTRNYTNNDKWTTGEVSYPDGVKPIDTPHELLTGMLKEGEELTIGKAYDEVLTAYNSGNIPVYLRMTVYRYWLDADETAEEGTAGVTGKRRTDLSPDLIDLAWSDAVSENGTTAWLHDTNASTKERDVFYYTDILPVRERTAPVTKTLTIKGLDGIQFDITHSETTDENGNTVYTTTYTYDDATFVVEATVDAVQTHNAADAIKSAWGVDVELNEETKQIVGVKGAPIPQPGPAQPAEPEPAEPGGETETQPDETEPQPEPAA